ncbi:MAG: hypothetical protein ACI9D5_000051 [Candidatus Endobugula sp.]|jgi:hypothetical protein
MSRYHSHEGNEGRHWGRGGNEGNEGDENDEGNEGDEGDESGSITGHVFEDVNDNGIDDEVCVLGANLVVNGDFESPPGLTNDNLTANSGDTFASIDGGLHFKITLKTKKALLVALSMRQIMQ